MNARVQAPDYADSHGREQVKTRSWGRFADDILNIVIQIADYYAPIVGEFEQLVLLALLRLGNGAYGAAILREIRERTGREVAVGALYMTLGRLESKKMICSYTGEPTSERGGRRRKHYLMDAAGQQALGRAYRTLQSMSEGFETQLAAL
jgi:PadR family transcriptional regulator, regulatory protein PadR